jgi:C4-dicarboxylate transporter DctM subunit
MLTTLCILGALLLILNIPMFVLMVATAVIVIWVFDIAPLALIATQMFGSIDKFALMAIPFFIFGATVMGAGGLTTRLVAWVESIVGWMRGGLAMTTIATCEVFGTVSGSSAATTAAWVDSHPCQTNTERPSRLVSLHAQERLRASSRPASE